MGVEPGYGETPLDPEGADALTPQAREIFGDEPKKIDLYAPEQAINDEVSIALLDDIADGRLVLADILTDAFLRDLHQKLYGDLWTWAGRYRTRDLNIGVEPEHIAVELRGSLDNIRDRWERTDDWTARELGIAVHAETVRIHGFVAECLEGADQTGDRSREPIGPATGRASRRPPGRSRRAEDHRGQHPRRKAAPRPTGRTTHPARPLTTRSAPSTPHRARAARRVPARPPRRG